MAWLERNRVNGPFQLVVRYGDQRLKRSTRTGDERAANEIASRVDRRLRMLETGEVELPDGVDVLTFLMSEGQRTQGPSKPIPSVSLEKVCDKFLSSLPDGALEANTLLTMRIHLKHIQRILGANARLRDINRQTLQEYVNARSKQPGRKGKKVGTVTIKKELTSFGIVWKYALDADHVSVRFPNQDLRFPKTSEKPRFQTWKEIELQISSEGLSEAEQTELWETLFLTLGHQTEEMVRRYRHLIPDQQHQAIQTVFGSTSGRQTSTPEGDAARQGA